MNFLKTSIAILLITSSFCSNSEYINIDDEKYLVNSNTGKLYLRKTSESDSFLIPSEKFYDGKIINVFNEKNDGSNVNLQKYSYFKSEILKGYKTPKSFLVQHSNHIDYNPKVFLNKDYVFVQLENIDKPLIKKKEVYLNLLKIDKNNLLNDEYIKSNSEQFVLHTVNFRKNKNELVNFNNLFVNDFTNNVVFYDDSETLVLSHVYDDLVSFNMLNYNDNDVNNETILNFEVIKHTKDDVNLFIIHDYEKSLKNTNIKLIEKTTNVSIRIN